MSRPAASSDDARRRMKRQRRTGTRPEIALRKYLWRGGLRYRVDYRLPLRGLRRRADIAFPGPRVAVFVDGCFWHCCPEHGTRPVNNAAWWAAKLDANVARDADTDLRLAEAGWTVVRVWEHAEIVESAQRIRRVVSGSEG